MEEMTLFFHIVTYECDAPNCSNQVGSLRTGQACLHKHVYNSRGERWEESGPFMRSELLNPSAPGAYLLRYSFLEENKIPFEFSFSPKHPDS